MNDVNYKEIGLKSGLEIHQQLDTKKLFCNCPSILRSDEPDFEVRRKLYAVAGQSGEVDIAAKYQSDLGKDFVYQGYDTTCLVELDEEPPKEINKDSLKVALQIALLLNCKPLSVSQIMRKTVVDGSNTSGFQRTVLIAQDGFVETDSGKVEIESICLEEDAARIVSRDKNKDVYRLDRLGIPLVEITTKPDIKTPEQAKEVALHIGQILRACKVKRGLGTIRQDVNMSIKNGNRIEIKGVQDPDLIEKTIKTEIERQLSLLKKGDKIEKHVRKALPTGETEFLRPMPGSARMYPETDLPLLKISRDLVNEIKKNLPKLRSEMAGELRVLGLNDEMIKLLINDGDLDEFNSLVRVYNNPNLIAKMILVFPREIATKKDLSLEELEEKIFSEVFLFIAKKLKEKKIKENHVKSVLERVVDGVPLEEAVEFEELDFNQVEEFVLKILKEKPGLNENAYMGLVMKEFKGKISGQEAMETIKKYMK